MELTNNNYGKFISMCDKEKYISILLSNKLKFIEYYESLSMEVIQFIKNSDDYTKNTNDYWVFWEKITNIIDIIKIFEYLLYDGIINFSNSDKNSLIFMKTNLINDFYIIYKNNKLNDEIYRKKNLPSKIKNSFWLSKNLNQIGEGKWMLFYNKIIQDSNGLTELDKMWKLINKKYKSKYSIKCSTCLCNPNTNNYTDGVIIIYSKLSDKDYIIKKIHDIVTLTSKVFWKNNNCNVYSKDGYITSSYSFFHP